MISAMSNRKMAIDAVRTPNYQETIEAAPNLIKHHNFTFGLILILFGTT